MSTQPDLLRVLVIEPRTEHTATVVFAHGLGDSGHGMRPVAAYLARDPQLAHVKWILPFAFDIYNYNLEPPEDEEGILASAQKFNDLIRDEIQHTGIPETRVVLGGLSQGGTTSLLTGLTTDLKLGGIFVLSGRLIMRSKIKPMVSPHARSLPIFWAHGTADQVVTHQRGLDSAEIIKSQIGISETSLGSGLPGLSFNSYQGLVHEINEPELIDLQTWVKSVVP
ncbi:hypothetical protein JAAARDRAFT_704876 [Jaapia argillacea MUCL 33604]|uniref:Acyl-protein thioesterase 1 n=1 Tax=Jaapia argillacea MUCL 33604 TaxID=933084 RepID=A0A067Q3H6_9AGAM|nr:hypothetical protein JAAARDRAFT_704876 [Jaapia argillacea MUCL 33604]